MVFSSIIFLFLFLPAVLAINLALPPRWRNLFLLAASLLFYAWGEVEYTAVMLVSIAMNYGFGRWVAVQPDKRRSLRVCAVAVTANLGLLLWFKYANFAVENLNVLLGWAGRPPVAWDPIHLPLGISFFTFQAMSYVVDVHRRQAPVQKSLADVALYITLFPQLIAGPIVRYIDVAAQIVSRTITRAGFASGVVMFLVGLGKKVLLANPLGAQGDAIFGLPAAELSPAIAWLGTAFAFLQIYYDFSGYSDMAVGLGRMLGFEFVNNFQHPYISKTMTEFWQRWHISLSTWFRDYLFNPLGGYRCSRPRAYANLMTVFVLCGLWHGASWNFLFFGLWQAIFLVAERLGRVKRWALFQTPFGNVYFLWVISTTMLLFRANDLPQVFDFLRAMYGFGSEPALRHFAGEFVDGQMILVIGAAVLGCGPVIPWLGERLAARPRLRDTLQIAGLTVVLLFCTLKLAAGTYNPFIYFRF